MRNRNVCNSCLALIIQRYVVKIQEFLASPVGKQQSSLANVKFSLEKCISPKLPDNFFYFVDVQLI